MEGDRLAQVDAHRRNGFVNNRAIGEEYNTATEDLQYKTNEDVHAIYEDIGIVAKIQRQQEYGHT